jgi:tetratricopeptide (TPR) repeat protein
MRGRFACGALVAVLAGCAAHDRAVSVEPAIAPTPPTSKTPSASHLEQGLSLYADKRYLEAAEAFEQAYKNGGSSPALFAEGQSLHMAGECARALEVFELLLRVEPDPTYTLVVQDLMDACR